MSEKNETLNLVKMAQQGSSDAFGEIIFKHERFVYNVVHRMLPNHEDAKDISQEVFIKAYRYLAKFDNKASFSTWLYKIAVNTCIDELRKRKGKETLSLDDEIEGYDGSIKNQFADKSVDVEREIIEKEGFESIKEAINNLSEEHKVVITLRDIEGLTYDEIANITQTSLGTVKSRLSRARNTLKELILTDREHNLLSAVK